MHLPLIGNKRYMVGKRKSTGNYAIWEHKTSGWIIIKEVETSQEVFKAIEHLKDLAVKRERRNMIADMCGTSYASAKRDMGL